jgi:hypothetical protein
VTDQHPYRFCRVADCERPYCQIWREAWRTAWIEGYEAAVAELAAG